MNLHPILLRLCAVHLVWFGMIHPALSAVITTSDDPGANRTRVDVVGPAMTVASGIGTFEISIASTGASGAQFVIFTNPASLLRLNLPTLNDTLTINAMDSLFSADFEAFAGAGNDDVVVNAITGSGLYTLDGGAGFDLLDVRGLGPSASNTGTSILLGGTPVISYANFESVLLAQPVPEPASLALLGIGLAGLGFARKKKAL